MNKRLLLLTTALMTGTVANAATYTFQNDHPNQTYAEGEFDLNSFLETTAGENNVLLVNSIELSVSGFSAEDEQPYYNTSTYTTRSGYSYSYRCSSWGRRCYVYVPPTYATRTTRYEGDRTTDTVRVDFGEVILNDDTYTPDYTRYTGNYYSGSSYYVSGNRFGEVSDSESATQSLIDDLMDDWVLGYTLNTYGDLFDPLAVSLTLDFDLREITPAAAVPVPAPALMLLSGLGALAVARRRRKKTVNF